MTEPYRGVTTRNRDYVKNRLEELRALQESDTDRLAELMAHIRRLYRRIAALEEAFEAFLATRG